MKIIKTLIIILIGIILLPLLFIFLINNHVENISKDLIYKEVDQIPASQTALILGAKVYNNGELSDILKDRAITAFELYQSGKVEKILISGDHGQEEYDEVNAVKDFLLTKGVNENDIFMDHAGFDTYDSIYRAKFIFQVDSLTIVTQEFHLARAVYIAKSFDIETYGIVADKQPYINMEFLELREMIARVKALFDIILKSKPQYLGDPIPITGDSKKSWD